MNTKNTALTPDLVLEPIHNEIKSTAGNDQFVARLYSSFSLAARLNPKILLCEPESLRDELLKAASDNLIPDGNEAALIPYFIKKEQKHYANYQPMVYGLIKRVKELGGVFSITSDVVRREDKFSVNNSDLSDTHHSYDPWLTNEERGGIVSAYAIFRDENERVLHRELMNRAQLDKVRAASKARDGGVWNDWEEEMCKKSVIRRGAKRIPTDNSKLTDLLTRMDSMVELRDITPKQEERVNLFPGNTTSNQDAPTTTSGPSQGASEKPEQQQNVEPLVNDNAIAQAFSDHCWGSARTLEDLNIDVEQFKVKNTKHLNLDPRLEEKLRVIFGIHQKRVSTKDHKKADETAIIELANFQIESPEPNYD